MISPEKAEDKNKHANLGLSIFRVFYFFTERKLDVSHKCLPEDSYKFDYVGHVTIRIYFCFVVHAKFFSNFFFSESVSNRNVIISKKTVLVVTCQSNHFDKSLEKITVCHEFIFKCHFYMTIERLLSRKHNEPQIVLLEKAKTNEAGTHVRQREKWTEI